MPDSDNLPDDPAALKRIIAAMAQDALTAQAEIARLKFQLARYRRAEFGRSSEELEQLITKVIKDFAAWALLPSFLDEHPPTRHRARLKICAQGDPPTVEMSVGWQNKWKGVLRRSEAWMIALFLARRAVAKSKPFTLRELAGVLVEDRDGDCSSSCCTQAEARLKAATDALKERYLPALEAYELTQVTWVVDVVDHFEIVATEKLLAFLRDRYFPALESTDDKWLEAAAKEGDALDEKEGDPR
jgi:hypothetical protein